MDSQHHEKADQSQSAASHCVLASPSLIVVRLLLCLFPLAALGDKAVRILQLVWCCLDFAAGLTEGLR